MLLCLMEFSSHVEPKKTFNTRIVYCFLSFTSRKYSSSTALGTSGKFWGAGKKLISISDISPTCKYFFDSSTTKPSNCLLD